VIGRKEDEKKRETSKMAALTVTDFTIRIYLSRTHTTCRVSTSICVDKCVFVRTRADKRLSMWTHACPCGHAPARM